MRLAAAARAPPSRLALRRACCSAMAAAPRAPRAAHGAAAAAAAAAADSPPTVLLLDVMDTLVKDPFHEHMPAFFGLTFQELLAKKHPTAWLEFERGEISEAAFAAKFFADGRGADGAALAAHMGARYEFLEGAEDLLQRLAAASAAGAGFELHACSNYPVWWNRVEERTALSRYLPWTFLSCEGPMRGRRKPEAAAFAAVAAHLGAPPAAALLVDDREANVEGARAAGMRALRFEGAAALERDLRALGLEF